MSLIFGENTCDRGQAPILVRLMEFGRRDACIVQLLTERFELLLVLDREVNVRRMVVHRTAIRISVFNCGVAGLNRLLREWEVSARDGVEVRLVRFCNLELRHDASFQG